MVDIGPLCMYVLLQHLKNNNNNEMRLILVQDKIYRIQMMHTGSSCSRHDQEFILWLGSKQPCMYISSYGSTS